MPNWIRNKVTIIEGGDRLIQKLKELDDCTAENRPCLFSSFVPRPAIYDEYDTTNYPNGERLRIGEVFRSGLGDTSKGVGEVITQELIDEYKKATQEQIEKYGAIGWYDWDCKHWGTKWDVSDWELLHGCTLIFDTAWSMPDEFFLELSKQFPEAVLAVQFADEDYGCDNCGCDFYKAGRHMHFDGLFMYAATLHDTSVFEIYEDYVKDEWEEEK